MRRIITLTPNPALDFSVEADNIVPNLKIACDSPRTDPGGGGINVSRGVHRLGAPTLAIAAVGGLYGDVIERLVHTEGVPSRMVRISGDTRIAFAARDRVHGIEYRFGLPGPALLESDENQLIACVAECLSAGDFLVGSGSLPPHANKNFWARVARVSLEVGARFVLDSTAGEQAALAEGLFLLRKNKSETAKLAGRELAWPEASAAFASEFVRTHKLDRLVLTYGSSGALMASPERVVFAGGHETQVVSAVGAGDSFVAALLTAMLRGENDEAALRWGMAGARATLSTPGTALFDPDAVARFYALSSQSQEP